MWGLCVRNELANTSLIRFAAPWKLFRDVRRAVSRRAKCNEPSAIKPCGRGLGESRTLTPHGQYPYALPHSLEGGAVFRLRRVLDGGGEYSHCICWVFALHMQKHSKRTSAKLHFASQSSINLRGGDEGGNNGSHPVLCRVRTARQGEDTKPAAPKAGGRNRAKRPEAAKARPAARHRGAKRRARGSGGRAESPPVKYMKKTILSRKKLRIVH